MMDLLLAQSPIHISGTDVMEMMRRATTTARMREGTGGNDDDDDKIER